MKGLECQLLCYYISTLFHCTGYLEDFLFHIHSQSTVMQVPYKWLSRFLNRHPVTYRRASMIWFYSEIYHLWLASIYVGIRTSMDWEWDFVSYFSSAPLCLAHGLTLAKMVWVFVGTVTIEAVCRLVSCHSFLDSEAGRKGSEFQENTDCNCIKHWIGRAWSIWKTWKSYLQLGTTREKLQKTEKGWESSEAVTQLNRNGVCGQHW